MSGKFAKISPFQVDPEKIEEIYSLTSADFMPADEDEKAAMEEMRKSVSYWRDAWRRFRANTVSMVALAVFILCLLFAFVGPALIPYSYGDQYRNSQKLGPNEYSADEALIRSIQDSCDGFFATALRAGSITALAKGDYYFVDHGVTYAFTLEQPVDNCAIVLDLSQPDPLRVVQESDVKDGSYSNYTAIPVSETASEGATVLKLSRRVFPHVFGTDSAGRDIMARTMYGARVSIIIGVFAALISFRKLNLVFALSTLFSLFALYIFWFSLSLAIIN